MKKCKWLLITSTFLALYSAGSWGCFIKCTHFDNYQNEGYKSSTETEKFYLSCSIQNAHKSESEWCDYCRTKVNDNSEPIKEFDLFSPHECRYDVAKGTHNCGLYYNDPRTSPKGPFCSKYANDNSSKGFSTGTYSCTFNASAGGNDFK